LDCAAGVVGAVLVPADDPLVMVPLVVPRWFEPDPPPVLADVPRGLPAGDPYDGGTQ
jgi:hypothetical protein